jgi:hypothetical protein
MCGGNTNHKVIHEEVKQSEPDADYFWHTSWQIIECLGCGAVSFRQETLTEDDFDEYGQGTPLEKLYPPRIAGHKPLEHQSFLPPMLYQIYNETLAAIANSLPLLAGIGLRALIETICNDQKVGGKNLEEKINALATKGILSKEQAKILHTHRFLGNVAAHEAKVAKQEELTDALDIAETMLKTIYVLPELDKSIRTGKKKKALP